MINQIEESIKEIKLQTAKKREIHIEKLLDYYNGNNTASYISRMFSNQAFKEIPPVETNITRKFINKMSSGSRSIQIGILHFWPNGLLVNH